MVVSETPQADGTEPQLLCDVPLNSIGYLARLAFRGLSRNLERRTAEHGVTGGQWVFLRMLWLEDGITQRELSHRVGMRESTTVTALNSMERAGFIRRIDSREDRRKSHVYLTPKGRKLEQTLLPLADEVNRIAVAGLAPAEVEHLRHALRKMTENLMAEDAAHAAAQAILHHGRA